MSFLNKEQILGADDRKYVDVEVPEWGGTVRIGSMSADELLEYEELTEANGMDRNDKMAAVLVRAIRDEEGRRLFTDEDIPSLKRKHPNVLLTLFRRAFELNKIGEDSAEKIQGE
jgi:hypothetical protein